MDSEKIHGRDPFPLPTHRVNEASSSALARTRHDTPETIFMSQVSGKEVVGEKEDFSLPQDLTFLFVMKGHLWDRPSSSMEKETPEELESHPRDPSKGAELSEGESHLWREQRTCGDASLTSYEAAHFSSSPPFPPSDSAGLPAAPLRRPREEQVESHVLEAGFCQTPSLDDTSSERWRTDPVLAQEESASESPSVTQHLSSCPQNADGSKAGSDESHSWEEEGDNRGLSEGKDTPTKPPEISCKDEGARERRSNSSSGEEELNLDRIQADGVLSGLSSTRVENHPDTEGNGGDVEQNIVNCSVPQLQEANDLILKENHQTQHGKNDMACVETQPEQREMEGLELRDTEMEEEEEEEEKGGNKRNTSLKAFRTEKEAANASAILDLDAPGYADTNLVLNEKDSFTGAEGMAFSFKEVSSSDLSSESAWTWPEYCDQIPAIPFVGGPQPEMESPETQTVIAHNPEQLEDSGGCDQAGDVFHWGQDGTQLERDEKEDCENTRKVEKAADGEQMAPPSPDTALIPDLHHSFDAEKGDSFVPSLRTTEAALQLTGACKDGTGERSVPPASCHLHIVTWEEVPALAHDVDDLVSSCGKDFPKDGQSSASQVPPDSLEALSNTSLSSSFTTWDSTQDATNIEVQNFSQQLQLPVKTTGLQGAAADVLCPEEDSLAKESACFSVLEQNQEEAPLDTDSPSPPQTLLERPADGAEQVKALASVPVPDSEQTLAPRSCSGSVNRWAAQFQVPPPTSTSLGHNPRQLQGQPDYPCSALKSPREHSMQRPESGLSEQLEASERDLNPRCPVPPPVPSSRRAASLAHNASRLLAPQKPSCSIPSLCDCVALQLAKARQASNSLLARSGHNVPTHLPLSALNRGPHRPLPDPGYKKQVTAEDNSLVQHPREASGDSRVSCPGGGEWTAVGSLSEANGFGQVSSTDDRAEEPPAEQLAKSEEANPNDLANACPDLGMYPPDSPRGLLGHPVADSFCSLPETTSKAEDLLDGRSFYCVSHPSRDHHKESRNIRQAPSLLAFTNPIHFLQLGPPSPPTVQHPEADFPEWPEQEMKKVEGLGAPLLEGPGRFRKGLEKSVVEPVRAAIHRNRHPLLEKSSSCPDKNVIRLDGKESTLSSKKQEIMMKTRAKSKDWHRQGVRKLSIPTDNTSDMVMSLTHPKGEAPGPRDKAAHPDPAKFGEKKIARPVEDISRRRHSKLINSSRLLYQEYSDDALNKAIQSQKRADSLSEEAELGSPNSPRLRRKVLSAQDSYLQRLSVSSGSSLWQDIPLVRESTMLRSMTHEEQKLQEAKFELIASEASYLRSLNVAVDHFQHSHDLQMLLTTQDKQWLFSRLQDVRDVSATFLFELEEKLEENMFTFNVCDVTLRNVPEFRRVYLPYVTNQTYQEQTFQRLMNGVPAFQMILEKLESHPVCQRLSLKSFLILPFQRITRLKLLTQNILKRIPPGADEEVQATQAYDALEKLIKDCNKNVQRMKSTEELIYLSQNMEFECKIFPLISQSRRLVKQGELTALEYNINLKWKLTTRPIYLHLFNDYLLLSRPRENGRFVVFDYASSSFVRGEKCEMKLHGANKNVFRLFLLQNHQGKKVEFLFRTETQSEKLRWISVLMPQQPEPDLLDDSDAPQVQCMKSYKARENDELTLEKADIVMVMQQSSDRWIEGVKLSDGERGWFPYDHVNFISSKEARQMNLKEEQRVKNAQLKVFRRK